MQREDVERLATELERQDEYAPLGHIGWEAASAIRALLAERDAAFAAGLQSAVAICKRVRSEVAENEDQAVGALECAIAIIDEASALTAKPRP